MSVLGRPFFGFLVVFFSLLQNISHSQESLRLNYAARFGPLNAGNLVIDLRPTPTTYEFLGRFKTSQMMERYYKWSGVFAAKGVLLDDRFLTEAYFTKTEDKKRKQVLIPPGVGNGFFVLSENSVFSYKWSYEGKYPDVSEQFSIKWNDKNLKIDWPSETPILQKRDR